MTDPVAELAAQLVQTRAFIDSAPITITLVPHVLGPDGKGGRTLTPGPPRTPQTFRMVETGNVVGRRLTEVGEQHDSDAVLLGMPNAAIAVEDRFDWSGWNWRVQDIYFPNGYEVRATVIRLGR